MFNPILCLFHLIPLLLLSTDKELLIKPRERKKGFLGVLPSSAVILASKDTGNSRSLWALLKSSQTIWAFYEKKTKLLILE